MLICNEVKSLVDEPGSAGHNSQSDDEPRFTLGVTGLFTSVMSERGLQPRV
jgi:hypothetical protein